MKIIDGIEFIKVDNKVVAISTGDATGVFKGIINLNDTAYQIWTLLEKGMSYKEIATKLSNEYDDLSYEDAYSYVKDFSDKLIKKGILIED